MTQNNFENQVVLVTGGTTGIGLAAAKLLLERGASVVITGRRQVEGQKAAKELQSISSDIQFFQSDVSQAGEVNKLVQQTVDRFGKLDIAFNNAGIEGRFVSIGEATEEDFDQVMSINLKGVWLCCKYEIEQFKKQGTGGAIVNTSSWLARGALSGSGIYSASKAALDGLTRALAVETASLGIRINNIQPGYIHTPMFDRFFSGGGDTEPFKKHTPLGRFGAPAEVAELVAWLSSRAASFVTGESILVDGGLAIGGQR